MKFTLNWLKRYLDTDASLEKICEMLTAIGLEVEGVEDKAAMYAPFKVAYVEKAEQHPNADKLKVCMVKTEKGVLQVVCGAPNARTGIKGIFAPEGTYIPGLDVTLKKTKIRDVESNGMLVSEKEMMLSDEHKGIIEVDQKYEVGTPMAEIFWLNDAVIEINLTPNRPDCAGVLGIARDLAAAGLGKLKPVDDKPVQGTFKSPVDVKIEDPGCPLFLGRYIKGVKNGPSPQWLQDLLKAVGLRSISSLVDITNFMSIDACRPLHVFDADKIKGNLVVKATKKGEKLEALTGKTFETPDGVIGIYDDSGLIDFGGMMGGMSTCIEDKTVNVYVESAYFLPERISRAGRDMQLNSDARYRFERGIDPVFTVAGMEIATKLILEICGGEASEVVQAGAMPKWEREIEYVPAYMQKFIGLDVDSIKQERILQSLGFTLKVGPVWSITPPSWRGDVMGKSDIAEEITRINGYDKIPSVSVRSTGPVPHSAETPMLSKIRLARNALAARGLSECVTWSFMSKDLTAQFGLNDNQKREAMSLKNPISSEIDVMRPSILPNLIQAAARNADLGQDNAALYEVGPVFESVKPEGQRIVAAGVRSGNGARSWTDNNSARHVDIYDAKADVIAALEACGAPAGNAQIVREAPDYYHPGRSGALRLGKNILAVFGEIHPAVLDEMKIDMPVSAFEIYLDTIPESKKKGTEKPLLKLEPLQKIERDFAFLVDAGVEVENLRKAAIGADKDMIVASDIFDIYTGKGVEAGKKSVALSITIQPRGASLTDAQIEALAQRVTDQVQQKTGGVLRT